MLFISVLNNKNNLIEFKNLKIAIVFFSKKNDILPNVAEKKCHVVPRPHE